MAELRAGVLFAHEAITSPAVWISRNGAKSSGSSGAWRVTDSWGSGGYRSALALTGSRVTKQFVVAVQGTFPHDRHRADARDRSLADRRCRLRFVRSDRSQARHLSGGRCWTLRFPREVGWGNAMRWLLSSGDEFDAGEAHRIGLVQEIVEHGSQLDRAAALADVIAQQAPPSAFYATLASSRAAIPGAERAAEAKLMPDLVPIMTLERRAGRTARVCRAPAGQVPRRLSHGVWCHGDTITPAVASVRLEGAGCIRRASSDALRADMPIRRDLWPVVVLVLFGVFSLGAACHPDRRRPSPGRGSACCASSSVGGRCPRYANVLLVLGAISLGIGWITGWR